MSDAHADFTASIPEFYDRELGPVLFEPFARDLAGRVDGPRVLEVASGTGVVTRVLRERLPKDAALVATDLNAAMLDFGQQRLAAVPGIEYRVADAQELPFPDASFDTVVCQFGIMFVPDKDRAAREALRVLVPGGRFVFSTWDTIERNAFQRAAHETLAAIFPDDPPLFYRVPFGFSDPAAIRALLERNGFANVSVENVKKEARAPQAYGLASGLIDGNPVSLAIVERGGTLKQVVATLEGNLRREFGAGPLVSTLRAWVATGTKPFNSPEV
jgi:ubiquinone/menaquinone biosynthesis C-methylase UbiE